MIRTINAVLFLCLLLLLACSSGGGGGGEGEGSFVLVSSNLGYSDGNCVITDIAPNAEIVLSFNRTIAPESISPATIQIAKASTGSLAQVNYFADGNTIRVVPRVLADITQSPLVSFGLAEQTTYIFTLPSTPEGDAVTLMSAAGSRLSSQLTCAVTTSQPFIDSVPGPPTPTLVFPENGRAVANSPLVIEFADILREIPVDANGQSPFIFLKLDQDGDEQTQGDQIPVAATFAVEFSNTPPQPKTTVIITPTDPVGVNQAELVIVSILPNISDIAGNTLPGLVEILVLYDPALTSSLTSGLASEDSASSELLANPTMMRLTIDDNPAEIENIVVSYLDKTGMHEVGLNDQDESAFQVTVKPANTNYSYQRLEDLVNFPNRDWQIEITRKASAQKAHFKNIEIIRN